MNIKFKKSILLSILLAVFMAVGLSQPARADLAFVGPPNPATGFPLWYEDVNGLRLSLCTDLAFCIPDPPNAANPFDAVTGFGAEAFWWDATASVALPDGGTALLVLGVEAAYFSEVATALDPANNNFGQNAFGRIRVRLINVSTPGTYSFIYPYGILSAAEMGFVVTADDVAGGPFTTKNNGEDWGALGPLGPAENFAIVLGSRIGGRDGARAGGTGIIGAFLTPAPPELPSVTDPATGNVYLRNPATSPLGVQVIGSPFGTNFFAVELNGTEIARTDLFDLHGQLFAATPPKQTSATFTRNAAGVGTVDVLGVSIIGAGTVDVASDDAANPLPGEPVPMVENVATADWTVSIAINANAPVEPVDPQTDVDLPNNVVITIDRLVIDPPPPAPITVPLTDRIVTGAAAFSEVNGTLTVSATSSNLFAPAPVLTVTNTATAAVLGTIDPVAGTLVVAGFTVNTVPRTVTVTSSPAAGAVDPAGGTRELAVSGIPAPVPPPADGGGGGFAPAAGGGGGGGGCFINSLF
jgi:hypothetical protein